MNWSELLEELDSLADELMLSREELEIDGMIASRFFDTLYSFSLVYGLLFVGLVPLFFVGGVWTWQRRRRKRHNPITHDLLRSPGDSIRRRLDKLDLNYELYLVLTIVVPLMAYVGMVSLSIDSLKAIPPIRIVGFSVLMLVATVVLCVKLYRNTAMRNRWSLGLDGEMATAEELNKLMLEGCRVFHDVPGRWGNIDHVVVSRHGVYSIETKVRQKPEGEHIVRIDYKTETMCFPSGGETEPFRQATYQRNMLAEWLSKATGFQVPVEAIIALPGWKIEREGKMTIPVINPKNPHKFILSGRQVIDDEQVTRIAHQLDMACRTVEVTNKRKVEW